jgi:hypothetical protein
MLWERVKVGDLNICREDETCQVCARGLCRITGDIPTGLEKYVF